MGREQGKRNEEEVIIRSEKGKVTTTRRGKGLEESDKRVAGHDKARGKAAGAVAKGGRRVIGLKVCLPIGIRRAYRNAYSRGKGD